MSIVQMIKISLQVGEKMLREFTLTAIAMIAIVLISYLTWVAVTYFLHRKLGHRHYSRLCKRLKAFFS